MKNTLRRILKHTSKTQRQVSLEIGVALPTLKSWLAGLKKPSKANKEKILILSRRYGLE